MARREGVVMPAGTAAAIIYLAAVNIAGFCVCAADKRAARLRRWRVPESALFAVALFFGSAGVYLAMLLFSHKTRKPRFAVLMPLLVLAQAAVLGWIFWRLS
jgi:uncharacterized membrane protein YsdA (DUF1294 family)